MRTEGVQCSSDWESDDDGWLATSMLYNLSLARRTTVVNGTETVQFRAHKRQAGYSKSLWAALMRTDMMWRFCAGAEVAIGRVASMYPPRSMHLVKVKVNGDEGAIRAKAKELGPLYMQWPMLLVANAMLERFDEDKAAGEFEQQGDAWPDADEFESLNGCTLLGVLLLVCV